MEDYDLSTLAELGKRYERERNAAAKTRDKLTPEIVAADAAGVPQVEIVKASRLTREAIRLIVKKAKETGQAGGENRVTPPWKDPHSDQRDHPR